MANTFLVDIAARYAISDICTTAIKDITDVNLEILQTLEKESGKRTTHDRRKPVAMNLARCLIITSETWGRAVDALWIYLKPTEACHTKANSRKKRGKRGKISTKGPKA